MSRARLRGKAIDSTFGNGFEKWDKVQYHGAEHLFYGRESPGPGAYTDLGAVNNKESSRVYSLPKVPLALMILFFREIEGYFS